MTSSVKASKNKADLIKAVRDKMAETADLSSASQETVKKIVEGTIDLIKDWVKEGSKVSFPGFGSFEAMDVKERTCLHPQTKAPIVVPASKRVKFTPSKTFKEALGYTEEA